MFFDSTCSMTHAGFLLTQANTGNQHETSSGDLAEMSGLLRTRKAVIATIEQSQQKVSL